MTAFGFQKVITALLQMVRAVQDALEKHDQDLLENPDEQVPEWLQQQILEQLYYKRPEIPLFMHY